MSFLINTPPKLEGSEIAKIQQIYTHLFQMSEQINYALNALASGDVVDLTGTTEARKNFSTAIMGGNVTANTPSVETYNELKSLIIKTGKAVNKNMAGLEIGFGKDVSRIDSDIETVQKLIDAVSQTADNNTELIDTLGESIYGDGGTVASIENNLSEIKTDTENNKAEISGLKEIGAEIANAFEVGSTYGSYTEAIRNKMSASAEGIVQKYELVSKLDAADAKAAGFNEWMNITKEYITTGFLYNETVKDPITGVEAEQKRVGVAVGTDIATAIVDGVIQQNATKMDLLATFVSDGLIFWQGGQKVAYFSNKKLYVLSAEFLGSYRIGDFRWVYNTDIGLVLEFLNRGDS